MAPLQHGMWPPARYAPGPFGRDLFRNTVEAMHCAGHVALAVAERHRGTASTIVAKGKLGEALAGGALRDGIACRVGTETIIVTADDPTDRRDAGRVWRDYTDTPGTHAMRAETTALNEYLARADVAFRDDGLEPQVDTNRCFLRRHFCYHPEHPLHTFQHSGRLYGGWWQNLARERRGRILIDTSRSGVVGAELCEVDYSALHVRIASQFAGVVLADDVDPYSLPGLQASHRASLKVLVSAMMTARGGLRRRPDKLPTSLHKDWTVRRVREAMLARFPHLEAALGERDKAAVPMGYRTQYAESRIIMRVLGECMKAGLVALPNHDGCYARRDQAERVRAIMEGAATAEGFILKAVLKG